MAHLHSCRHGRLCLLANRIFLTMMLHILCHVDPVCHVSVGKGSSVQLDGLLEMSHDTAAMHLSGALLEELVL